MPASVFVMGLLRVDSQAFNWHRIDGTRSSKEQPTSNGCLVSRLGTSGSEERPLSNSPSVALCLSQPRANDPLDEQTISRARRADLAPTKWDDCLTGVG